MTVSFESRDLKHDRLDALDLGELRNFTIGEEDARDAIDRLEVCDVCGCIGDKSRIKYGPMRDDATRSATCDKHWNED